MKTIKHLLLTAILCLHPVAVALDGVKTESDIPCYIEIDNVAYNLLQMWYIFDKRDGTCKHRFGKNDYFGIKGGSNYAYEKEICDKLKTQMKICLKSLQFNPAKAATQ